jgi:hypothetical protein
VVEVDLRMLAGLPGGGRLPEKRRSMRRLIED